MSLPCVGSDSDRRSHRPNACTEDLWKCPSRATVANIAAEIIHQARERDVQTPVVTPVKTWPETDAEREAFIDWQDEVGTGGELRGFRDWLAAKEEERG
jgi:hypothetical protein